MNNIHNEFVVTPIDNGNGNGSFILQRLYVLVLKKELVLDRNITSISKAYIQVNRTNNHVIIDYTAFLKDKFNLEVVQENERFLASTGRLNLTETLLKPSLCLVPHDVLLNLFIKTCVLANIKS